MSNVLELKARVYDLIAEADGYNLKMQEIQKEIQKLRQIIESELKLDREFSSRTRIIKDTNQYQIKSEQ